MLSNLHGGKVAVALSVLATACSRDLNGRTDTASQAEAESESQYWEVYESVSRDKAEPVLSDIIGRIGQPASTILESADTRTLTWWVHPDSKRGSAPFLVLYVGDNDVVRGAYWGNSY